MLVVDSKAAGICQPIVLSEFGGIAFAPGNHNAWGYSRSNTPQELLENYCALLEVIRSLPVLAGFCYTQFTDTYQEANGLLFADRTPKVPFEQIALATNGSEYRFDALENSYWRDRLMERQR